VSGGHIDFGRIVGGIMSGLAPDALDVGSIVPFAARGIIAPLQDRLASGSLSASSFYPAMWTNGNWRGQVFGIPALDHGPEIGLIWNQALNPSVLSSTGPDLTPSDILRSGKLLTTHDASGAIATLGFDPLDGVGGLLETARDLTGQDWIDPAAHRITFANAGYQAYLDEILSYYKDLGLDNIAKFRQDVPPLTDSRDSGENRGRQVAIISGYWSVSDVAALEQDPSWSFQATWAPAAQAVGKVQRLGGRMLVIPSGGRDPVAGWDLIQFLVGDDGNDAVFKRTGRFVATRSFTSSQRWKRWPALQFFIESLANAAKVTSRATSPVAGFAEVKWEQTWRDVLAGNRSSADALNAAQKELEVEYQHTGD
jgi:ABC-type glycerol-3-phosphate transport system substrate-binding protein